MHFLTEREVLDLNDSLMAHSSLVEKGNLFANMCQDPKLKNMIERQNNVLQHHITVMCSFLEQAQGSIERQQPQQFSHSHDQMQTFDYQTQRPQF